MSALESAGGLHEPRRSSVQAELVAYRQAQLCVVSLFALAWGVVGVPAVR
jgi:hypothetical protein